MKVICEQCGKPFSRAVGLVKKSKHHFCSKKCYVQYRRTSWKPKKYKTKNTFHQQKLKRFALLRIENGMGH